MTKFGFACFGCTPALLAMPTCQSILMKRLLGLKLTSEASLSVELTFVL